MRVLREKVWESGSVGIVENFNSGVKVCERERCGLGLKSFDSKFLDSGFKTCFVCECLTGKVFHPCLIFKVCGVSGVKPCIQLGEEIKTRLRYRRFREKVAWEGVGFNFLPMYFYRSSVSVVERVQYQGVGNKPDCNFDV